MRRFAFALLFLTTVLGQPSSPDDPWIVYRRPPPPPPPPPTESGTAGPGSPGLPSALPTLPTLPGFGSLGNQRDTETISPETLFTPGTLVSGRLLTGVYLVPGKPVPVAAETTLKGVPVVLVGQASFDVTGRVWVEFDTAVVKGQVYPVHAVGLEAEEVTQGLPAKVGEEAPNLLADLVRGALGGISDFVKATLEATTVTTAPGGGQVVQKSVPGIELFLLARAADLVAVPKDTRAVIRTVKVERDTPFFLLFLPGGDRQTGEATSGSPRGTP